MSLWYKTVDSITFADIEAFCLLKLPEGLRLDYKLDIPNDLEKLVAAFANTLGGLIVLGVKANKTNNEPDWPPRGMTNAIGIEERITAICRDNIYPPVRPEISPIIDNPDGSGTVLAIIRVIESPESPHAVKGFVYERVGSQGRPYHFSQIDRIKSTTRNTARNAKIPGQKARILSCVSGR
jgi:predicted HTH transcriptional regulator